MEGRCSRAAQTFPTSWARTPAAAARDQPHARSSCELDTPTGGERSVPRTRARRSRSPGGLAAERASNVQPERTSHATGVVAEPSISALVRDGRSAPVPEANRTRNISGGFRSLLAGAHRFAPGWKFPRWAGQAWAGTRGRPHPKGQRFLLSAAGAASRGWSSPDALPSLPLPHPGGGALRQPDRQPALRHWMSCLPSGR